MAFDSLTPKQQQDVQNFLQQMDQIPVEQLTMMKTMLEAQRAQVPEEDIPMFLFILQAIDQKLSEKT